MTNEEIRYKAISIIRSLTAEENNLTHEDLGILSGFILLEKNNKNKLSYYKHLEEQGRLIESKQGQWDILTDEYDCEYMKCSVCDEEFYPVDEDTVDRTYNYCPNCGAKMDEVEND